MSQFNAPINLKIFKFVCLQHINLSLTQIKRRIFTIFYYIFCSLPKDENRPEIIYLVMGPGVVAYKMFNRKLKFHPYFFCNDDEKFITGMIYFTAVTYYQVISLVEYIRNIWACSKLQLRAQKCNQNLVRPNSAFRNCMWCIWHARHALTVAL